MGNFADLISPYLSGHSIGVAELAGEAAQHCRDRRGRRDGDPAGRASPRPRPRGGPLADLAEARTADGRRVGAGAPAPVPHRARPLALAVSLGAVPDRGGSSRAPRRIRLSPRRDGRALALPARLLAAADAYHAMTEPRPHREPLPPERAAQILAEEASAGRLDPDAVAAVLEAAGQRLHVSSARPGSPSARPRWSPCSPAGCRRSRSRERSESRSRRPTGTSRTPTARSASPPAPRQPCSRWSTGSSHGENSRLRGREASP